MRQFSKRVVPPLPGLGLSTPSAPPPEFLTHGFSEDGLHRGLLIVVLILAGLALVDALTTQVAVWRLDPVLIQVSQPR